MDRRDGLVPVGGEKAQRVAPLVENPNSALSDPPMRAGTGSKDERCIWRRTQSSEELTESLIEFRGKGGSGPPERGQMEGATVLDIQRVPKSRGQLAHLDVKRGLREVELFGGPREVEMVGEDGKGSEAVECDQVTVYRL